MLANSLGGCWICAEAYDQQFASECHTFDSLPIVQLLSEVKVQVHLLVCSKEALYSLHLCLPGSMDQNVCRTDEAL